tara:strand:+ start:8228 stop:8551 length:324 start_codon:yes stop_codon:yes gene_type:complete
MTDKVEIEDKDNVEETSRQVMNISPSRRRILEMNDDMLLKNYALIVHRASSLSSAQRKMIEARIAYAIKKGRLDMNAVAAQVNDLTKYIEEKINAENGATNDDSITE